MRQMPSPPISRRVLVASFQASPVMPSISYSNSQVSFDHFILPSFCLVVLLAVEYPKDGEEQVDDA